MATITSTNVSALMSSIAKHCTDLIALVGSTSAITAGQATTLGKVAALNDASQEYATLTGFESFASNENALLAQLTSTNAIYDAMAPACMALERATGGLNAFLVANSIQAPTQYANAHNRCASVTGAVVAIASANISGSITPAY